MNFKMGFFKNVNFENNVIFHENKNVIFGLLRILKKCDFWNNVIFKKCELWIKNENFKNNVNSATVWQTRWIFEKMGISKKYVNLKPKIELF